MTIPFIVRFSEPRQEGNTCLGIYSFDKDIRLVREGELTVPLVNSRENIEETKTITKVERERED